MDSQIQTDFIDCEKKEDERPLFSVIVLCYKNRGYLNGMLKSIFCQNYPNIQLIVSDDGSRDFVPSEVEEFINLNKGENIKEVIVNKNQENMRTVRHIDKVLKYADGEYIVFTAADDRFNNPSALTIFVDNFMNNTDDLWAVASCNIMTSNYEKSIYVTPTEADAECLSTGDARKIFSRWSRRGIAIPCSMAFRKSAFDAVGGIDLEYNYLEDWPLVLKLLRNGYAPIYIKDIVAVHSAGGVTNSNCAYGVEVRAAFFDDKELVYQKEVKPYIDMLEPEDLALLAEYRKEINSRQYFLDVKWVLATKKEKLKLLFDNKDYFKWLIEDKYWKIDKYIKRKKMILFSQVLLFVSGVFTLCSFDQLPWLFDLCAYLYLVMSCVLLALAFISYPIKRYFVRIQDKRKKLVN